MVAINKFKRSASEELATWTQVEDISEEILDVEIMLQQIKLFIKGMPNNQIDFDLIKVKKLSKLESYLKK